MSTLLFKKLRFISIVVVAVVLMLIPLQTIASAQSVTNLSARISRLESENSVLRSRISRLESQLSRSDGTPPARRPQPTPTDPARGPLSSDPMFDRLATLAIEQRERMDRLEARLAVIEERLNIRN